MGSIKVGFSKTGTFNAPIHLANVSKTPFLVIDPREII